MPLELVRPEGLWLLLLLLPLALLYVLRVRRSRRIVPSLLLWRAAAIELSAQRPFRRFIPRISLIIQTLAILALASALTHPTRRSARLAGSHVGVVVDAGITMQTKEPRTGSRFEEAKSLLRSLIAKLPPGSDMFIVAAGSNATLLGAPLTDRVRLGALADSLSPEDTASDLEGAIAQATQRLRRLPGSKQLVVIGDGGSPQTDAKLPGLEVSGWRVGSDQENAAVHVLDVRRTRSSPTTPERVEVLARVSFRGTAERSRHISLRQANTASPLDSRHLQLAPGEEASVVLSFEPAVSDTGAALIVELSPHDALDVDDSVFVRIPDPERLAAVVIPPGASPWLERAIAADGGVDLYGLSGPKELTAAPPDAIVFSVDACPRFRVAGDLVVVNPPAGSCLGVQVGAEVENPPITSWDEDDPRLRFVSLDDITIARGRLLGLGSGAAPLVQTESGAIVVDASTVSNSITLLGFDLDTSNWPVKASFVMFVRNLLETARRHRLSSRPAGYEVGRSIRVRVPGDVESAVWTTPDGSEETLPVRSGVVVIPTTKRAGHYFLAWLGQRAGSLVVPVNPGRVSFAPPSQRGSAETRRLAQAPDAARTGGAESVLMDLSPWLAAVALLLVALDLIWMNWRSRRPHGQTPSFGLARRPG